MNLQQLYYFKAISEKESFTRAAERYFVSASNLSHAVTALEQELGVPLIIRNSKKVELTACGERFLKRVTAALAELDSVKPDIGAFLNDRDRIIRVGAGHSLNVSVLSGLIQAYYNLPENSGVTFERSESASYGTQQDLLERKIDVGFNHYMGSKQLSAMLIESEELMLIVPAGHSLAERENVSLSEILDMPLVTFGDDSGSLRIVKELFAEAGAEPNIVKKCTYDYLLLEMVSSGLGAAILAKTPEMDFYPVRAVRLDGGIHRRYHYMLWRNDVEQEPQVKAFIEFAEKYFREKIKVE